MPGRLPEVPEWRQIKEWPECEHCGQPVGPVSTPAWTKDGLKYLAVVPGPMECSMTFIEEESRAGRSD